MRFFFNNLNIYSYHLLALGAASWCFQCDSRNPGCQIDLSPAAIAESRIPCNGQCYVRMKEGSMLFKISVLIILFFILLSMIL